MERHDKMKKQVAKWLTAVMPGRAWGAVLPFAALTAMGLAFMWFCPDAGFVAERLGAYWVFWRQALWMGIGLSCFFLAVMVGWRRWIKAAPWLAFGWLVLLVIAICSPQVGHNLYVRVGAVQVNVLVLCPLVMALLLAWIAEKLPSRRTLVVLLVAAVAAVGAFAVWTLDGYEGMARIFGHASVEATSPDEVMLREWAQKASGEAGREAHWFSGNSEALRQKSLPGRFTYSMPFAVALVFGKWYNVLAMALFGILAVVLTCCYRRAKSVGKKAFVAVVGVSIILKAVLGYSGYLGLMPPMLRSCVPLVSYGGSVVIFWLVAGVLVSLVLDDVVAG